MPGRSRIFLCCWCFLTVLALARPVFAQNVSVPQVTAQDAYDATLAALVYLFFETDTLPTVEWPAPRSVLSRQPGTLIFNGISTRFGEDPASAEELTNSIVENLRLRGLQAKALPRRATSDYCTRRQPPVCTLPRDVSLLILVGYPPRRGEFVIAQITLVMDSGLKSRQPAISLDVLVQSSNGEWRVDSIRRTLVAGD